MEMYQFFQFFSACQAIPLLSPSCNRIKGHAVRGGKICLAKPPDIANFRAAGLLLKKIIKLSRINIKDNQFIIFLLWYPTVCRYILVADVFSLPCPFTRMYENFCIVSAPLHRQLNIPAVVHWPVFVCRAGIRFGKLWFLLRLVRFDNGYACEGAD